MTPALFSPVSGRALSPVSPHVLAAGDERWPVFDGIAFLRADRRAMADAALDAIDRGDVPRAGAILLTDQDPFAPEPPPTIADNLLLLADEPGLSFRDAMQHLRLGRVADYFAHRWTDPTFLSGLVLATALPEGPVLELACGAGHYLPALERLGSAPVGSDLVFAKLWLCRRFVHPAAALVCFDAAARWPFEDAALGGVFCHDAFYFIPDKAHVIDEVRRCAGGVAAIGHAHNALAVNHSSGLPLTPSGYADMLGDCAIYDDAALTASFVTREQPRAVGTDTRADALSFVSPRAPLRPERLDDLAGVASLRLNPLYQAEDGARRIAWPSARYEAEYAALATYPVLWTGEEPTPEAVRRRVFVELPARW